MVVQNEAPITLIDTPYLEDVLGRFQPKPSIHFYQRMDTAPWLNNYPTPTSQRIRLLTFTTLLILFLVFLSGTILTSRPIDVIARQLMEFFVPELQDDLSLQVTLLPVKELDNFTSPENYLLTISDAVSLATFRIRQLTYIPENLHFVGARYDPDSQVVSLLYLGKGYNLLFQQRPQDDGEEIFSIGSSAQVEYIQIGDLQGEYVTGGWKMISDATSMPDTQTTIDATWDPSLPQYTLRWQIDGLAFELRSAGSQGLLKAELIKLAESIK